MQITFLYHSADIDECSLGISGCSQLCINTAGNFVCECYSGYQLSSDNRSCIGGLLPYVHSESFTVLKLLVFIMFCNALRSGAL